MRQMLKSFPQVTQGVGWKQVFTAAVLTTLCSLSPAQPKARMEAGDSVESGALVRKGANGDQGAQAAASSPVPKPPSRTTAALPRGPAIYNFEAVQAEGDAGTHRFRAKGFEQAAAPKIREMHQQERELSSASSRAAQAAQDQRETARTTCAKSVCFETVKSKGNELTIRCTAGDSSGSTKLIYLKRDKYEYNCGMLTCLSASSLRDAAHGACGVR